MDRDETITTFQMSPDRTRVDALSDHSEYTMSEVMPPCQTTLAVVEG